MKNDKAKRVPRNPNRRVSDVKFPSFKADKYNYEENSAVRRPSRNPNKRPCVATNISFSSLREMEKLLRKLEVEKKTRRFFNQFE